MEIRCFSKLERDRVQPLDAGFDLAGNAVLLHLRFHDSRHFGKKRLVGLPLALDDFLQLLIALGVEVAEREILEFSADFAHAEPIRKRRIDVHGFPSNGFTAIAGQVLESPHVVQAIGKLHHDDPNIVGHREKHLAEVFGLLFFLGGEVDLADLGDAIDDVSHIRPEDPLHILERDERVLDDVVQQSDADCHGIHFHFCQDVGDFQRMGQVRFARCADLSFMLFCRKDVSTANQVEVIPGMVLFYLRENVLKANHGVPIIGLKKAAGLLGKHWNWNQCLIRVKSDGLHA